MDASVWVSRFVPSDVHHPASLAWLHQHLSAGNVAVAPTLLLAEVGGAIARRSDDSQLAQQLVAGLRQLPGLRWVALTIDVRDRAAYLAASLRLRGADAVYVALAHRLSIPLITWDGEQLTRTGPAIAARTP